MSCTDSQLIAATESTTDPGQARGIDKSALTISAPRRYRNRAHLRYSHKQACLLCGRKPSDPHHLGFTEPRAFHRKVSDEFVRSVEGIIVRCIAHATSGVVAAGRH